MFRRLALLALALGVSACAGDAPESRLAQDGPPELAALAVDVTAEVPDSLAETRTAFMTDGAGAAWFDALAGADRSGAAGFTVGEQRVLDAWTWHLDADSSDLAPRDRVRGVARPDAVVRAYAPPDSGGVLSKLLARLQGDARPHLTERVTLLDGRGALLVEVPDSVGTVAFRPLASDRRAADAYRVQAAGDALVFGRADADSADAAAWTAVVATGNSGRAGRPRLTRVSKTVPERVTDPATFTLGEIAVATPGRLVVATGRTPAEAAAKARAALGQAEALREARSARMAALLTSAPVTTSDARTNAALGWALLSLDALVVRADSGRTVLMPGLPGQEPAGARSTMETVPAFLAAGQWETARALLLTTAGAQLFDRRLQSLGRAPDAVRPDGTAVFATAEATPLFLAAMGALVRTTGERALVSSGPNFWFKTVFALRGVYERDARQGAQTDTLAFLTTREGRGTAFDGDPAARGIVRTAAPAEAQGALWQALRAASDFSRIMGVSQRSNARWYADTSAVLAQRFATSFGRGPLLADRLDARQQPLPDVRPGGLLALARLRGALPDARRAALARPLAERLVFPYGVATLDQADSLFHPYVDSRGGYALPAARTEGLVWPSLAGPVIGLMAQTGGAEPAAALFAAQADLMLDRGTAGALPELVDGNPRGADARPGVGGAPVSPWGLAGLLQAAVEGIAGATVASPDTLTVEPHLTEAWGATTLRMRMGRGRVTLRLTPDGDGLAVSVVPQGALPAGATLRLRAAGTDVALPLATVTGDTLVAARDSFTVTLAGGTATVAPGSGSGPGSPGGAGSERVEARPLAAPPDTWAGFAFAVPDVRDEYPVTRARAERRALAPAQVRRDNPTAAVALTETDPAGDDWGATSTFTYPEGVAPGALDATYLEVARDDSTTYFRVEFSALPAGDVRTVVAIALDTSEGGERTVGRTARYAFPETEAFDVVIYAGTDVTVEDGRGSEIATVASAGVFDAGTGTLTLAIPTLLLPRLPRGTKVTVLVGAADGEGGFRPVRRGPAGEDGGGRAEADSPNVYDVVVGTMR